MQDSARREILFFSSLGFSGFVCLADMPCYDVVMMFLFIPRWISRPIEWLDVFLSFWMDFLWVMHNGHDGIGNWRGYIPGWDLLAGFQ